MTDAKLTVGKAIDDIAKTLEPFDGHERNTILTTVCALLKMGAPVTARPLEAAKTDVQSGGITPGIDIKTLKNQKQPSSAREMACVVAYYLSEVEQQPTITTADIEKYFKQAGFKLPVALEQILPDAKKAGYFDLAARGEYKLNRVGHNAVVHSLPKKEKG